MSQLAPLAQPESPPPAQCTLPPEVLLRIFSTTIAAHLDSLIAGDLRKPDWRITNPLSQVHLDRSRAECNRADPAYKLANMDPTLALLHASYQLREITL